MCLAWGLPVSLFENSLKGPYEKLRLSRMGAHRGCRRTGPPLCHVSLPRASCVSLGQGSSLLWAVWEGTQRWGAMTSRPPAVTCAA